ncbi:hypothetical protein BDR07DRAFT_1454304 [Suillus spraguei]|nr:hypothetical protein BDR07DRAFT_1454304 [Suillus spraguei]
MAVDFCGCDRAQTHTQQLLCVGWFPATAATFCMLWQFHILSFELKVSAYKFYHSLVHMTDNTGLSKRKDRYEAFMCMVHEFWHVKMLKRGGRGHDPSGIVAMQQGECARLAPKGKRWLYSLFVAIDANFRLKRCIVSKDAVDPSLSCGWGYFVDETAYKTYITDHGMVAQEKSTCTSHNALPNGVGDLQKGERYINMDFLFFSTLRRCSLKILNVSYDIACQWHKNLWARMASLPENYQLDHAVKTIHFFIPKFHLPAHITKCQMTFSFNWSHWVGRTDGEAPDTKEMCPGCRRDTLDIHFGDWNWKKVVNLGASLLHKMKEALQEKAAFHAAFEELNAAITEEHRTSWKAEAKSVVIMQAGAHLKLVQLEAKELEGGADVSLHPEVSPSIFVGLGLDPEEEQMGLGNHITDTQKGNLQHQRNVLHRKIESWWTTQALYMPVVHGILSTSTSPSSHSGIDNVEDLNLLLPSAISNRPCHDCLQVYKWELRLVQAHDTLEELQQCLQIHSLLLMYKKDWVCGQGANTRAQNALERVTARQAACTARYHASWEALNILAQELGKVGWQGGLRPLEPDDIRPLIDPDVILRQGRQKLTYIWRMSGMDSGGDGTDEDSVRVEWCNTQARAMCWAEEVELLHEEMCRVLQFFQWQATWWDEQGHQHVEEDAGCLKGIHAYAAKQANICRAFISHFQILWSLFLSPDPIALLDIVLSGPDHAANLPDLLIPPLPEM